MRKSLDHLPQNKQDELHKIVVSIKNASKDVDKIILFGSYARGDYKEQKDLSPIRKSGHVSDYDILVVTGHKKTTTAFGIWDEAKKLPVSAVVRIIAIDIQMLNINLAEGQYLFNDIKKEGIMLYDAKKYKLLEKQELEPKERARIAKKYFDHWFDRAEAFFKGYNFYFNENDYKSSAFNLNQSVEHAYKTIFLVFINYNPNEHYLDKLAEMCKQYHLDLANIFVCKTKEEQDRFELLDYAYIGARYDLDYHISKEDLEILAKEVKKLIELTKKICEERIKGYV